MSCREYVVHFLRYIYHNYTYFRQSVTMETSRVCFRVYLKKTHGFVSVVDESLTTSPLNFGFFFFSWEYMTVQWSL